MTGEEWIDGMTPERDGKWTKSFIFLTQQAESACIIFHEDASIFPMAGQGMLNRPTMQDHQLEELVSDVLDVMTGQEEMKPISGIILARRTWMFGSHVAQSEVDAWGDKPIKDHPESVLTLECIVAIATTYRKWIVTLDRISEEVTGVFEDGREDRLEERMVEFGSVTHPADGLKKRPTGVPSQGSSTLQ